MPKLQFTNNMIEVTTIALLLFACVMMLTRILGYGDAMNTSLAVLAVVVLTALPKKKPAPSN